MPQTKEQSNSDKPSDKPMFTLGQKYQVHEFQSYSWCVDTLSFAHSLQKRVAGLELHPLSMVDC